MLAGGMSADRVRMMMNDAIPEEVGEFKRGDAVRVVGDFMEEIFGKELQPWQNAKPETA